MILVDHLSESDREVEEVEFYEKLRNIRLRSYCHSLGKLLHTTLLHKNVIEHKSIAFFKFLARNGKVTFDKRAYASNLVL